MRFCSSQHFYLKSSRLSKITYEFIKFKKQFFQTTSDGKCIKMEKIFTRGFIISTASENWFSLTVTSYPPVKNDFYWPLVLLVLKNISINRLKTTTVERLLLTRGCPVYTIYDAMQRHTKKYEYLKSNTHRTCLIQQFSLTTHEYCWCFGNQWS
jgi:hypothetical protein